MRDIKKSFESLKNLGEEEKEGAYYFYIDSELLAINLRNDKEIRFWRSDGEINCRKRMKCNHRRKK